MAHMKIASWNVNSIKMRSDAVAGWLQQHQPDVLCLQELKCETGNFPGLKFQEIGYTASIVGQKAYNGVAVLSRGPVETVHDVLPGAPDIEAPQARYLEVKLQNGWHVINIYAPNGNPLGTPKYDYKLAWLAALQTRLQKLLNDGIPFVVLGDFNIIPQETDCHDTAAWMNDALFQPAVRQWYQAMLYQGLTDAWRVLHRDETGYTFWDYQAGSWPSNNGIRIDHILLSPALADRLHECTIDTQPRGAPQPSDHTVIMATLQD